MLGCAAGAGPPHVPRRAEPRAQSVAYLIDASTQLAHNRLTAEGRVSFRPHSRIWSLLSHALRRLASGSHVARSNVRRLEMSVPFNADEIFAIAEQIERNADRFYRRAAQDTVDSDLRKKLLDLAAMENA
jgi:hypothetical protein